LKTLVLRAWTHCSSKRDRKKELEHIERVAIANGFSTKDTARTVHEVRKYVLELQSDKKKLKPFGPENKTAWMPFHPSTTILSGILKKYGIKTQYIPPGNIAKCLVQLKDPIENSRKSGIYKIPCKCGKVYIGETMRSFEKRIKEHQKDWTSAVQEHNVKCMQGIDWDKVEIISGYDQRYKRKFKEAIEITKHNNFNQDEGLFIPKEWKSLAKEDRNKSRWVPLKGISPAGKSQVAENSQIAGNAQVAGDSAQPRYNLRSYKRRVEEI
jgi:hypothetical protein